MQTEHIAVPRPSPRVAILVLNWNRWRDTLACLESVRQLSYANYLVVVVDNGSGDDSVERIRAWVKANRIQSDISVEYDAENARAGGDDKIERDLESVGAPDRLVLITSKENLGRTGGVNLGITYALRRKPSADYVFVVDNDATTERDCLTALVELDQRVNAGVVGGLVLDDVTGKVQFSGRRTLLGEFFSPILRSELPVPEQAEYWSTANISGPAMLFRRDVLDAVFSANRCFLDNGLFMDGEELAFCQAAHALGYQSMITRVAVVRHKGQRRYLPQYNPMRHYYLTRNRIVLAGKLLPLAWRALFHLVNPAICIGKMGRNVLRGQPRTAQAIACGLLDGYRGIRGRWKKHPVAR